jgi:phosphoglycolate phosphatase-like HAD superfamily hydrolase
LAVLSNKLQRLTEAILRALGIARYFQAWRGGGLGLPLKPDAAPLTALMRELGVEPGRTLMVGDKPADVNCARGAGAHIAAVTYGYGEPEALRAAQPDFLLARVTQLPDIIA